MTRQSNACGRNHPLLQMRNLCLQGVQQCYEGVNTVQFEKVYGNVRVDGSEMSFYTTNLLLHDFVPEPSLKFTLA